MRTRLGTALAAGAVAALAFTPAAPAGAQEAPGTLGFEIDRTEGRPGEEVNGQVDVDDVAEHCATDVASVQARYAEVFAGPFGNLLGEGELFDRFFPGGEYVIENHDQLAYGLTGSVAAAISGALNPEDPGPAELALRESFVMTFADIATQEPVGSRGTFDPATGQGSVLVPDLEPGLWAVAAACVAPTLDLDLIEAGLLESSTYLQQIGAPPEPFSEEFEEFVRDYLGDEEATLLDFVAAIAPDLLEPVVTPDALGVQLFCVYDGATTCEQPPPTSPPGTTPPAGAAPPATPVRAQPSFTG